MSFLFVAGFAVISSRPGQDIGLFADTLGIPLRPPASVPNSEYRYSERIEGVKHFGVWPLSEAASDCFGIQEWTATHPLPQATIEFEVDDVETAAAELRGKGYLLVHSVRTEPWGQVITRFQSSDGLLRGVCKTPQMLVITNWAVSAIGLRDHCRCTQDVTSQRQNVRNAAEGPEGPSAAFLQVRGGFLRSIIVRRRAARAPKSRCRWVLLTVNGRGWESCGLFADYRRSARSQGPVLRAHAQAGTSGTNCRKPIEEWHTRFLDQSVELPGPALDEVCAAADAAGIWVALGITERAPTGTLCNALVYIDSNGRIAGLHRKLVVTDAERLIWANGQGPTLTVVDIGGVKVGSLACWENYMPFARAAPNEKGIDVLLAPTWDNSDEWVPTLRHMAKEGRVSVVGVTAYLRGCDVPRDLPGAGDLYSDVDDHLSKGQHDHGGPGRRDPRSTSHRTGGPVTGVSISTA